MNKMQLRSLLDAIPDDAEVFIDCDGFELDILSVEFFPDDGSMYIKTDGAPDAEEVAGDFVPFDDEDYDDFDTCDLSDPRPASFITDAEGA